MATSKQRPSSPLARILKDYRTKYDITQEQLASELGIDVRTLRRYENGETILSDINELKRIAGILGIEPELLGVATPLVVPGDVVQIDEVIERIWRLVRTARNFEARVLADKLTHDLTTQITTSDPSLLRRLAHAQHVTGYVYSVITRANETDIPRAHYHAMEQTARAIDDQTLLAIALTYQGDMYCRGGKTVKGIEYLEAVRDTTPLADSAARGNAIQLLGRAYLRANRFDDFERAMKEAEELAFAIEPDTASTSTRGQYDLGTVYEEYGRSYAQVGQTQKALDYLDRAEANLAPTKHWEILLKTARAMALVHGSDIQEGVNLAVESLHLCRIHGTVRLMERIYGVQQYLDNLTRNIGQASATLRAELYGPVEY
ncbi:MAG: helix-turn-helix transcriptional regulator [Ktedonobacteraceae bacterium]|nr:helix-turn-helix transcriptional regulator [Ktedonobacteraceae bacterium]